MRRRYRLSTLRARRAPRNRGVTAAMRFGRARLSALRRGTRQALRLAQLRAAFVSVCLSLRCRNRLLASSSRPSRSAGEAGSEAARERSVWLRPQGPHSLCLTGAPSRKASLRSERRCLLVAGEGMSTRAAGPLIPRRFLIFVFAVDAEDRRPLAARFGAARHLTPGFRAEIPVICRAEARIRSMIRMSAPAVARMSESDMRVRPRGRSRMSHREGCPSRGKP